MQTLGAGRALDTRPAADPVADGLVSGGGTAHNDGTQAKSCPSNGKPMAFAAIRPYFAVPLATGILPQAQRMNPRLRERLLTWERNEPPRTSAPTSVPKHAVYESDFALFDRGDPVIAELANACLSELGELIMRLNQYDAEEMRNLRIFHHSWFHVTRHGGYTGLHNHPMASWSGVYCVDPGEQPAERPTSGVLRIFDSRPNANMYIDAGNAHMTPPFTFGRIDYSLQPGQLVLFPSFLYHEVVPFWGHDERITVAFNAWVREANRPMDEPGVRLRSPPQG